jgi:hypothetical protein
MDEPIQPETSRVGSAGPKPLVSPSIHHFEDIMTSVPFAPHTDHRIARSAHGAGASFAVPFRVAAFLVAGIALSACSKKKTITEPVVVPITSRGSIVPVSSGGYVEARTSQIVSNGALPGQVFDDFTFTGASTIRTVAWQGIYCVQAAGSAAPAPTATAFKVSFYADSSGKPRLSTPLSSTTYPLAQAAQTFEKNQSGLTCGSAANTNWSFYKYTATLTTPFAVTANTKYWFSVQALTPSYDVYFGWRDGIVDNSLSWQLFNGAYASFAFDRAFSLTP